MARCMPHVHEGVHVVPARRAGKWIDNPNVALYASNANPGQNDDNVITLTILSNPVYNSGAAPAEGASGGSCVSARTVPCGSLPAAPVKPCPATLEPGAAVQARAWCSQCQPQVLPTCPCCPRQAPIVMPEGATGGACHDHRCCL